MFNLFNGIPVKEYHGDKTDISFFSLTRYLKQLKDVGDVRTRIMEDLYPLMSFPPSVSLGQAPVALINSNSISNNTMNNNAEIKQA